jgi:hypothetical protein
MVSWRGDGKELYYLSADRHVVAVQVDVSAGFAALGAEALFRAPGTIPIVGTPGAFGSVSRDGERVVFAVPPMPDLRRITVFDRGGNVVAQVEELGLYGQPALSPDGSKIAVAKRDRETGESDIWSFDLNQRRATRITADRYSDASPVWSADGERIFFVSTRDNHAHVYGRTLEGDEREVLLFRSDSVADLTLTDVSKDGRLLLAQAGGVVLTIRAVDDAANAVAEFRARVRDRRRPLLSDSVVAYHANATGREGFLCVRWRLGVACREHSANARRMRGRDRLGGDGSESCILPAGEPGVMVMAVDTDGSTGAAPEVFRVPGDLSDLADTRKNMSADAQHFSFAVPLAD